MRRTTILMALAAALQLASPACAYGARGEGAPSMKLAGPTTLSAGRTVVKLRSAQGARVAGTGRVMLAIEGLSFDAPPGVLYEVHLQGRSGRRALVGLLNFYNDTAPGYGAGPAGTVRTFDATEALRAVGGVATALVFEPTAGVTGVGARVNPRARVRFASVSLRPL